MKNLRKLFCVACAVLFFTSCEETYNDKLFWPGEISQEYGSYIKPYTLDLTYSGEKLIGKTASFKTEDSETGTLTLNGIIPGEVTTPISRIKLNENGEKDAYTFSGTNITMGGVTVKYNGIITPKAMKLSLDVTMAHANNLAHTYAFPAYSHTTNEEATIRNSGASYVNITTKEGAESIAPIVLQMQQMATNILDVLFPYVLKNITLEKDGIVTANYTTSPIDMKEIMEVANAGKPDADVGSVKSKIQKILGDGFRVQDRYEQQADTFRIMEIEKLISYIFLTFILMIACFNVIGSLSMLIIDKKADVVTLRNLGASDKLITRIFLFEGRMISLIGAVVGVILGLILCFIQQEFGLLSLGGGNSGGNFVVDAYPVSVHVWDIVIVFATVLVVGFLSVWYPVRYLSRRLLGR